MTDTFGCLWNDLISHKCSIFSPSMKLFKTAIAFLKFAIRAVIEKLFYFYQTKNVTIAYHTLCMKIINKLASYIKKNRSFNGLHGNKKVGEVRDLS